MGWRFWCFRRRLFDEPCRAVNFPLNRPYTLVNSPISIDPQRHIWRRRNRRVVLIRYGVPSPISTLFWGVS